MPSRTLPPEGVRVMGCEWAGSYHSACPDRQSQCHPTENHPCQSADKLQEKRSATLGRLPRGRLARRWPNAPVSLRLLAPTGPDRHLFPSQVQGDCHLSSHALIGSGAISFCGYITGQATSAETCAVTAKCQSESLLSLEQVGCDAVLRTIELIPHG